MSLWNYLKMRYLVISDTEFKCLFDLSNHDPDLLFKTEGQKIFSSAQ